MILLAADVLLVFFLILLSNFHVLPLQLGDFIFFSILALAFALYRPAWSFLLFSGTIMLENINLAPPELGIAVRPYQFFAGITILAIIIRLATKRLNFRLAKLAWFDFLVIAMGIASFISSLSGENRSASLKQSVVFASFIFIYFLVRNFIQSKNDLKKVLPFFVGSSAIVMLYGIWQNMRFLHGMNSFEVMPGRPNATFVEADWYGIYLSLLLAIVYTLIFYFNQKNRELNNDAQIFNFKFLISKQFLITKYQVLKTTLFIFLVLIFINLILTVSRSAWLGAAVVTFAYLWIIFTDLSFKFRNWKWRETIREKLFIIGSLVLGILIVYGFHLTNFQLGNRIQSAGSGLQQITISCQAEESLPNVISSTDELAKYNCRHINLEDIDSEKAAGHFVTEIYRNDPNVKVRSEIYAKVWETIKAHPIFGIGFGQIGSILGTDERGAGLNASNIFLEVWLGAGIIGLLAFMAVWMYILFQGVKLFLHTDRAFGIFLILGFFALLIPNFFNSGIFLGILWMFFGITFVESIEK